MSHCDLDLYIGSNDRDIALKTTVQTVNKNMNDNKAQLGNDDSTERLDMANGKFLVERETRIGMLHSTCPNSPR